MRATALATLVFAAAVAGAGGAVRTVLLNDAVSVPPSGSRFLPLRVPAGGAVLECWFALLEGGSGVRVALLARPAYERFRDGRSHEALAATSYVREGRLSAPVETPGEYGVLLDNRLEGRGPAEVRVEVTLAFDSSSPAPVRELSRRHRAAAVILSLVYLFLVAGYTASRLRRAARAGGDRDRQRRDGPA